MNFYESISGGANHPLVIRQPHPSELRHAAALHESVLPSQRTISEILERGKHPNAIQMSAFKGDKMVATVSLAPVPGQQYVYEVDRLVTQPEFRGQGIGRQILLAAEKMAHDKGAKTLVLDARPGAHGFFSAVGYDTTDQHAAGPHINMTKLLDTHGNN